MSCAVAAKLREQPETFLVEDSPERRWGLRHAQECPACRRTLLLLDPTLAVGAPTVPEFESGELESLKAGVLNAKRLREMEAFSGRSIRGSQIAAAVTLVASLALLLPGQLEEPGGRGNGRAELSRVLDPGAAEVSLPAVETLDLPRARVYELGDEDFSVVMIVDESLDL